MNETKLSLRQKIILAINGRVYIEHRTRPGWRGSLPFYAFICPKHGLVEDYPHGFKQLLICPLCLEEIDFKDEEIPRVQVEKSMKIFQDSGD